jgi:DNA-binding GntR family transcriptional regulator
VPELQEVLPKYLQIAGHIRDQIVRGALRSGDEVPSERELAATFGVARPTATKALDALRVQGLVESRQGSGTYVRRPPAAPRARERYDRAGDLGTMYSESESVEFLAVELVDGPSHIVEALQLGDLRKVIRRARLIRHADDGPIEVSTSWFAGDLAAAAPGLLQPERIRGGTAPYVASASGRAIGYARDQVCARLATADERRWLDLPRPSAVLAYRLTVCDDQDRPLQVDEVTSPPDLWTFQQDYPLPHS